MCDVTELERNWKTEKAENYNLSSDLKNLKNEHAKMSENLLEMQARFFFLNFDECETADQRRNENSTEEVLQFCEPTLKIQNGSTQMKLDRAHRIVY